MTHQKQCVVGGVVGVGIGVGVYLAARYGPSAIGFFAAWWMIHKLHKWRRPS